MSRVLDSVGVFGSMPPGPNRIINVEGVVRQGPVVGSLPSLPAGDIWFRVTMNTAQFLPPAEETEICE